MRLKKVKGAQEKINKSKYIIKNPKDYKGKYNELFNNDNKIEIEIGMGKGDFIYENARLNPDINYIGIEKYPSVLAAAINKINLQENKVSNLRLMRYDAIELNNVFEKNRGLR